MAEPGTPDRRARRAPVSTYRLQITAEFDLHEAARRLPYLHDLGVDWVYLSPLLAAEPGSEHGYDVVAHDRIDLSRGGAEGLAAVSEEARRLGMGVLVDIVPNHVGVATPAQSAWWWELLRDGPDSLAAHRFDVDWAANDGRVLVPIVGDDDLRDDGTIAHLAIQGELLCYHDHRFPIAPGTVGGTPDEVHAAQHYELAGWRRADDELNYRRFFTINTLAAIRVEDPDVFTDSHVEIRRWFDEGLVDGLRVDHPDGLRDPEGYLTDLSDLTRGSYALVEKILALRALRDGHFVPSSVTNASSLGSSGTDLIEGLDPAWSCEGTTGYDALAFIDRVLTDPAGEAPLGALEGRLRGGEVDWHQLIHDTKRDVAEGVLHAEVRRIVRDALPIEGFETTTGELEDAVAELLACFPVYRSYLPHGAEHVDEAFALARQCRPDLGSAYDVLAPVLRDPTADAALRFQQTSGMVMAKGVEDCAFYRYSRLTSLNEVGGDPSVFAMTPAQFHGYAARRQHEWPDAMTALTTHDTKRSEDVRARITALAEVPELWEATLGRVLELAPVPDPAFGNLLWQAVVGVWPVEPDPHLRERLHAYAEKAMREAGDRTTWTAVDEDYEAAVHGAVDAAFDDDRVRDVLDELLARITAAGWSNALAAKLLALTMPGVPDVYQGTERMMLALVDPDNRQPVTFPDEVEGSAGRPGDHFSTRPDEAKSTVTATGLRLRRDRPELFTSYDAVPAEGPAADHVLAFDRGGAITVVTRLPLGLAAKGGWGDTMLRLPEGDWMDVVSRRSLCSLLNHRELRLADLLTDLPVALLVKED